MTITSVQSGANTTTNAAAPTTSTAKSAAMDKDAFLKLLVAQLSNQDPMNPVQGTEYVTQLAQFTAVEQSLAQSQKLDMLSAQLGGIANNEAVSLVGKQVTVKGTKLAFDGVASTSASVTLGSDAQKVTVSVQDANGKTIRTMELGKHGAGAMPINWNGCDDNGQKVAAGSYSYSVTATTADGSNVSVSQDVKGVVKSVSYAKGYPEMLLDSGATAPLSDLVSVGAAPAGK
jgi:flagellar basal-body rod modification protein FlgD